MKDETKRPKSVLIVDTDSMCRKALKRILVDRCSVDTAYDVLEAINKLAEKHFDTLVVDYDLPDDGAIDVFRYSQNHSSQTMRIVMANANVSYLPLYLNSGLITDFLTRNSHYQEIIDKVLAPSS